MLGQMNYSEGSEAQKQVAQKTCGWPIHVHVQGQVGWGPDNQI